MKFYRIDETASAGSTGTGSIATSFAGPARRDIRHGEHEWRNNAPTERENAARIAHTRGQLDKAKALKQSKKPKLRDFVSRLFRRKVGESMSMDISGITSQLKGLENKNNFDTKNTVTYGVEDDEGNLMKITVKTEDAKSFENRLAMELGELEDHKIQGYQNSDVSLAEVLFNLKDEFNIVDVEFPEIPSDIIYNADKATLSEKLPDAGTGMGGPPQGGPPQGGPPQGGEMPEGPEGMDDMGGPPQGGDMGGDAGMGPEGGDMGGGEMPEGDEDLGDEDMGEDFAEGEGEDEFKTMFNQLMDLMSAQVEKETAIANAEAEKARALQAEFSAKAANHEVSRQEELVRMQAEMDSQKKKEKEAKQYADIAKYRVNKDKGASGMNFESTSFLAAVLAEDMAPVAATGPTTVLDSDLDTEDAVRKQISMAREKYRPLPTDDAPTKQYKAAAWQKVNIALTQKLGQIRQQKMYAQQEQQAQAKAAQQQTQQAQGQVQQATNFQSGMQ